MDKFLITGFSGFVSQHFLNYLESLENNCQVLGIDVNDPPFEYRGFKHVQCSFTHVDLLDKKQVDNVIYQFQPNYILHLASYSSVAYSWQDPVGSFSNNTNIFLNLVDQVRTLHLDCRILSIGSSEEYGNAREEDLPLREDATLRPLSPYAVARVSQEMLSKIFVDGYGLDIVLTRSFNHIGPGQRDVFVISSFAKQLTEIKKFQKDPCIVTGDLSIIRDFLDVRDVVRAYYTLFKHGRKGELYNICSGNGTTLEHILQQMMKILEIEVETKVNPSLIRPNDNKVIIGNNKKIVEETNWKINYPLEKSLEDILNYWWEKI